jgi:methyl-accepting chemotaxis protein
MTVARRLILTLTVALLSLILVGSYGLWQLRRASQRFEDIQLKTLPAIEMLGHIRVSFDMLRRLDDSYLVTDDASRRAQVARDMSKTDAILDDQLAMYERNHVADGADRRLLSADRSSIRAFRVVRRAVMNQVPGSSPGTALALLVTGGAVDTAAADVDTTLTQHGEYEYQLSQTARDANAASSDRTFWTMITMLLVALLLTGWLGVKVYRIVIVTIGMMELKFQKISSSLDLSESARILSKDEFSDAAKAFNVLLGRVSQAVSEVRQAAESVNVGSREIAAGNTELSTRTEQQAASLEQTAASMQQLTETVRQNVESARSASLLAGSAARISERGNQLVERMVCTMNEIASASGKIAEITSLIEGIAFQTNILALNAAVEAARAGDLGRGFAVVASEVRNLAQRSSSAAKEIKQVIAMSGETIQRGSSEAENVGMATSEVREAVRQVASLIRDIASASEEQARGIEQINLAVGQMDHATQQNAALVEEAAAAAQSMKFQASKLTTAVAAFKVP